MLQDFRFALRMLRKTPAFSLAAVLVLAAGIGVNTAVFTFINALVLRPINGGGKPGELVQVFSRDRAHHGTYRDFSYPNYLDLRDRSAAVGEVTAFTMGFAGVREGDLTRRTMVGIATGNYFSTLGRGLAAGRTFEPEEERPEAGVRVAVASYDYWKAHGASSSLVGSTVSINAQPFTIVGVAPRGFTGTTAVLGPELWVPTGAWASIFADAVGMDGRLGDRRFNALQVAARLKPGLSPEASDPSLRQVAAEMARAFPAENRDQELLARPLSRFTLSSAPQNDASSIGYSMIVMVMAGIVLVIAAMNLANMMTARNTARQKEIAMRVALGGGRGRIVRQLLTEGFVLSFLGGAVGLLFSYWVSRLLWVSFIALSPIPMSFDPTPDARVLLATLGFCVLSTVIFGLGPAWRVSRADVWRSLKVAGSDLPEPRSHRWSTRDALVAAQLALSLALLTAAGLFVRGAIKAASSDPGYRLEHRAVAHVDASLAGYDQTRTRAVYARLVERVRALPGVTSASPSSVVAFDTLSESQSVRRAGTTAENASTHATYGAIGTGYFRTLGLRMLRGRDFTAAEEQAVGGQQVAIVDQPLAKRLFGADDPLGREVEVPSDDGRSQVRLLVVGVAPGLRQSLWDKAPVPHLYVPTGQTFHAGMHLVVQMAASSNEANTLQALRREIRLVDERLPILSIKTMTEHRDTTTTYWAVRAMATIFSTFGVLALLLALVGVYAVKAYMVARRTREIGIRMALGSTSAQVLGLVVKEGLGLTAAGLVLGFLLAAAIGRLVGAVLFDVSPFDPLVFGGAPLLLAAASLVACYVPARRATRIAPLTALRSE